MYPGPNSLDSRSNAWRSVVFVGVTPMSSCPRCSENSGMIRGARIASATTPQITGCRVTVPAQRAHRPVPAALGRGRRKAGSRAPNTCRPSSDTTAGSSVIAAVTAVSTAIAVTKPSVVTSGIPATDSEISAITTVVPANTMALPDVATARAIDSW